MPSVQTFGPARPYDVGEIAGPKEILAVQGQQAANQLRELQINDQIDQQQGKNALRAAYAPENIDQTTGYPNANSLMRLSAQYPAVGQTVRNAQAQEVGRLAQAARAKALEEHYKSLDQELMAKSKRAAMPYFVDSTAAQISSYEQALANGKSPEQATQDAISTGVNFIEARRKLGVLGNEADGLLQAARDFEPMQWRQNLVTAKQFLAQQSAQDKAELSPKKRERYVDGDTVIQEEFDPATRTWNEIGRGPRFAKQVPGVVNVNAGGGGEDVVPSEDAKKMNAYRLLFDGTYPSNMGRGVQGANERKRIDNEAARIAKDELGLEMDEIRLYQVTNKEQLKAVGQLGRARAQILQAEKLANMNADLALAASKETARSGVPLLNRGIQWAQENLAGDEKLRKFTIANETFVSEYAKVMGGGYGAAAPTEGAQNRAHQLLNRATTQAEYEAAVKQLKAEMVNREKSLNMQMDDERGRLRLGNRTGGTTSTPSAPKTIKWNELP